MLATYHHQKTKTAIKKHMVKKNVQKFLKINLNILQAKGASDVTRKHYCLDLCLL